MTVAGRRSRDRPGPDGAPRDDGSDVRWGSDWQYIASLYPDTKPYLWGLAAAIYDQALRARPGSPNPFWGDDPDRGAPAPGQERTQTGESSGPGLDPKPKTVNLSLATRNKENRMATPLVVDAQNRAVRTFLVGLSIDLAVAVALVLVNVFTAAGGWDELDWKIVGFSLAKTVVATAGSYVLRRFIDPSRVPTPLPPAPVPAPADPNAG